MPPTRSLLIWAGIAIACAVILTVEGTMLLSGRQRPLHGWRLGVLLLLGNFFTVGLAARLYDIHTVLLNARCNCDPFTGTEPQITVPVTLATVLGSLLLAFTVLCSALTLKVFRSPDATVAPGSRTRAWSFSRLFLMFALFALLADGGAWILTNGIVYVTEYAYLINPAAQGDGLGILPLFDAIASSLCGAVLLIVPLTLLLLRLRRSLRVSLSP